jgi:hypothetical protein
LDRTTAAEVEEIPPSQQALLEYLCSHGPSFHESLETVEKLYAGGRAEESNTLYQPPIRQLRQVNRWSVEHKWGLRRTDFERLGSPPQWPEDVTCALLLVVNFASVGEAWQNYREVVPGDLVSTFEGLHDKLGSQSLLDSSQARLAWWHCCFSSGGNDLLSDIHEGRVPSHVIAAAIATFPNWFRVQAVHLQDHA